jgi:hypothetical protein
MRRNVAGEGGRESGKRQRRGAVSRILFFPELSPRGAVIYLVRSTRSCPGSRRTERATPGSLLFDLAPGGVCHALSIALEAVVSYTTFSPLPFDAAGFRRPRSGRYGLCGTFHRSALTRNLLGPRTSSRSAHSEAPCPVESGLSSLHAAGFRRPWSERPHTPRR